MEHVHSGRRAFLFRPGPDFMHFTQKMNESSLNISPGLIFLHTRMFFLYKTAYIKKAQISPCTFSTFFL